jgi:hypothetical protein
VSGRGEMWLDRLSSHSTPSGSPPPPSHRGISPAPRRPSHLAPSSAPQRPGFSPRSSSLSLASSESNTSAPVRNHSSALKQSTTISNAPDPLVVLERLLGPEGKGATGTSKAINGVDKDEESDFALDLGGLSLRELLAQETPSSEPESVYNSQTIEECTYHPIYRLPVIAHLQQ